MTECIIEHGFIEYSKLPRTIKKYVLNFEQYLFIYDRHREETNKIIMNYSDKYYIKQLIKLKERKLLTGKFKCDTMIL